MALFMSSRWLAAGIALGLVLDLLRDRSAVLQELCPGGDHMIAGLEPIENHKIISDSIAKF